MMDQNRFAVREISNQDLREEDIPGPDVPWERRSEDERPTIQAFALTFNGYLHWDPPEKAYEVARGPLATLTQLPNSLFCFQRSLRDFPVDGERLANVRMLLERMRELVAADELD
jgi:hypothetical protein